MRFQVKLSLLIDGRKIASAHRGVGLFSQKSILCAAVTSTVTEEPILLSKKVADESW